MQLDLSRRNKQLAPLLLPQLASLYNYIRIRIRWPRSYLGGAMSMIATSVKPFSKKLSCPSSNLLVAFIRGALAREINSLIKHHLTTCDFCYCEMPLLAFYSAPSRGECGVPDLPINLRVLAESILGRERR